MRKFAGFTAAVMLLGLTATTAVAQQGTAELRGSVRDEQGLALPGVAILITNQDSGTFREAVTGGGRQLLRQPDAAGHLHNHRPVARVPHL